MCTHHSTARAQFSRISNAGSLLSLSALFPLIAVGHVVHLWLCKLIAATVCIHQCILGIVNLSHLDTACCFAHTYTTARVLFSLLVYPSCLS